MGTGDNPSPQATAFDELLTRIKTLSSGQQTELLTLIDDRWGEKSRQADRKDFFMTVDYVVADRYYRDFIQDMSDGGVFIKTRQAFKTGQEIRMTFMSPDLKKPFKIEGEIMRALDNGIGVRFRTESPVQAETIAAMVNQIQSGNHPG
ncbi:MAG: PilZ domain-containing protein [Desulfobacterales bacterium]|nr:PilZ domain-containing protein [Desulfobacterales bacterium]